MLKTEQSSWNFILSNDQMSKAHEKDEEDPPLSSSEWSLTHKNVPRKRRLFRIGWAGTCCWSVRSLMMNFSKSKWGWERSSCKCDFSFSQGGQRGAPIWMVVKLRHEWSILFILIVWITSLGCIQGGRILVFRMIFL